MQPAKGDAIIGMETPADPAAVRRFLGMANYVSRFVPNLAEMAIPLRQLTHKDVEWKWEIEHQNAFERIQAALTEPAVLRFSMEHKRRRYNATHLASVLVRCYSKRDSPLRTQAELSRSQKHITRR